MADELGRAVEMAGARGLSGIGGTEVVKLDENSKRTRVVPVFTWLRDNGGADWPTRFLELVDGLAAPIKPGAVVSLEFERERRIPPSTDRLAWMIRNADRLAPRDGAKWREYRRRVMENPRRSEGLEKVDRRETQGLDRLLILEGKTSADCLIECKHAVVWIEGKRNDWLDYSTTWDVTRDQLARNTEAAWLYAGGVGKDFCLIVCHEFELKHHESLLIEGYRRGTWSAGWPHLGVDERRMLGSRIGTVTWRALTEEWEPLGTLLR
jgi:hypothetical protein